ncbi:hypothetical protein WG66_016710 [Moniliophthora roreri]|nr:hypothetical protein WG66_016710 [Moniliophthora roreri]
MNPALIVTDKIARSTLKPENSQGVEVTNDLFTLRAKFLPLPLINAFPNFELTRLCSEVVLQLATSSRLRLGKIHSGLFTTEQIGSQVLKL